MDGICTLGNDKVYDQLVALINSVETFAGADWPICIFPYDHHLSRVRQLAAERPQVQLWDDAASIQRWDAFVAKVWAVHPTAPAQWRALGSPGIHRMGTHRRLCAFDGPFDRFVYMDADTLLLSSPDLVFDALMTHDWVTYDFQHKDLSHIYNLNAVCLKRLFAPAQLHRQAFCSGFYGSRRGLFQPENCQAWLELLQAGEADVLYPLAPDQTLLNYLVMRSGVKSCNLALTLPGDQRTGNAVTSSHFEEQDHRLYDRKVPLVYLHYIGLPAELFSRLCRGENLAMPYRDIFLHYRYCHQPMDCPQFTGTPQPYRPARRWQRYLRPLNRLMHRGLRP